MVAAVSRLAALLKQATAGDVPAPVVTPDPDKAALIKTLVTPRAPRGAEPMPSIAPPLIVPTKGTLAQRETSPQIIDAYRTALELEEAAAASVGSRSSAAGAAAVESETGLRSLSGSPTSRDDAVSAMRAQPMPNYALAPPLQVATILGLTEETAKKRRPGQIKPMREESWRIPAEVTINARMIAFAFAALALFLLIILLLF